MEDGLPIPAVSGLLKSLGKPKSGTTNGKDWFIQTGELTDGKRSVKLFFSNCETEVPRNLLGKRILIEGFHGDKGWAGVYAEDNEYKGETTRQIKITKAGTVSLADSDGGESEEAEDATPTKRVQSPKPHSSFPSGASDKSPMPVFGGTVGMCMKEACGIVNSIGTDPRTTEYYQQVKYIASNLIRTALDLEAGKLSPAPWHAKPKPAPAEDDSGASGDDDVPM